MSTPFSLSFLSSPLFTVEYLRHSRVPELWSHSLRSLDFRVKPVHRAFHEPVTSKRRWCLRGSGRSQKWLRARNEQGMTSQKAETIRTGLKGGPQQMGQLGKTSVKCAAPWEEGFWEKKMFCVPGGEPVLKGRWNEGGVDWRWEEMETRGRDRSKQLCFRI